MKSTQDPEEPSIYGFPGESRDEDDFGFWYAEMQYVYEAAPRNYLEKEIEFLRKQIIKMGRGYWPRLIASSMAAKDVHHTYYGGRIRDPEKDDTISRGPMHTGNGRKNSRPGPSHSRQPDQLADGPGA